MHFYAQPVAMRDGYVPVDVGLIQVTPPDEEGYVYMGTSCDQTKVIVNKARITIAQVNKKMPHVMGDTRIPVSDIDYFVEYDEDIYELPLITSNDPISEKIGYHISTLIEDGACLQMGQGNVPNAILKFIEDKKDIGIHTEVFSDNLIPLIEKGVVNGMKKNIDQGKIVATFVQGTKDLYEFVDNNPMIQLMPVDYTNDVGVIAKNDNVVAINSATQVDLMGQVVADSIGTKMFSGVGGQQDFIRGAEQSKGGRPIIALPSTAKGGEVSRIVAVFERGTPITTTRNDVHYVVTEYGIADLFGKSINQRADALINIAHPKFREQLRKEFQEYQKSTGQIHVLHD
jgi:4-hydroxybutyrate CoA-transferase